MNTKGLMALGLKRVRGKVWTGSHYRTRNVETLEDLRVGHWCWNKDCSDIWFQELKPVTLKNMGLQRNEDNNRIEKLEGQIQPMVV